VLLIFSVLALVTDQRLGTFQAVTAGPPGIVWSFAVLQPVTTTHPGDRFSKYL